MKQIGSNRILDRFRGTLVGGAVGDALGYAVEFMNEESIHDLYGKKGITEFSIDPCGKALFSDDTQMSLFTASGILCYKRVQQKSNDMGMFRHNIAMAYRDWLNTQEGRIVSVKSQDAISPLMSIPELYSWRSPGNTCVGALGIRREQIENGCLPSSFFSERINNSKGCGAVMRAAPLGLFRTDDIRALDMEGAEIGAITHGHSLGFLPSAMLVHIVNRIVYSEKGMALKGIMLDARDTIKDLFSDDENIDYLTGIVDSAIELSENNDCDLENIHLIGEGWVGEEALAIAIYCALRHKDDFSAAIVAAVNHRGDSDSTGAITGNIIGAWLGYKAIDEKWKSNLELFDVLLNTADMLYEEA